MFSNLSQNSILYILDLKSNPKVISGPIERISLPRPKYNTFNPNMEMVIDITAVIGGEKHQKLIVQYEEAQQELNPDIKINKEKDKAIQNL